MLVVVLLATVATVAAVAAVAAGVVALSPVDLGHEVHTVPRPGAASQTSLAPPRAAMVPAADDGQAGRDPRSVPTSVPGEGSVGPGGAVFDDSSATVANLDPALLDALRTAATAALHDGVELHVNSGWRSAAEQERLLEQAVAEYGSVKEARRWVATPETSAHVSGDAVDLGPSEAARWLARHGAAYGLCQIYRNEPWHFELRQGAALDGCPSMYADPTQDPRMTR